MVFSHLLKQKLGHLRQHASRHASVESSPVIGCPSGRILMHRCVRPTAASVAGATLLACCSCGNAQQTRTRSARVGWRQFEQLRGVAARRVVDGDVEDGGEGAEVHGVRPVGMMALEDVAVEAIDDEQAPLPQAAGVGWQQRKHVVREHERVIGAAIDAASDGRVCWTVEEQRCVRQRA